MSQRSGICSRERRVTRTWWGRCIITAGHHTHYSGAWQVLHRDRASGLPLNQRLTRAETHFPDKWAAVISIGLFGQRCPIRKSSRALEKHARIYVCTFALAGTHTHTLVNTSYIAQMQLFTHFNTSKSDIQYEFFNLPTLCFDSHCASRKKKITPLFIRESVSVVCAFSMCKFSQAAYVTASLFHTVSSVLAAKGLWVTRDIDKIILHTANISGRLWAENGC